jgi:hypothetical protein
MPDTKEELEVPFLAVDKEALALQVWRLMNIFWETETADLTARLLVVIDDNMRRAGATEEALAELRATHIMMQGFVGAALEDIVVERLVANNRNHPLLRTSDTQRVLMSYTKGNKMDEQLFAAIELARPFIHEIISALIARLTAIDADMYNAVWRFGGALISEAARGSMSPLALIDLPIARAQVIGEVMSQESWRMLAAETVKRSAKVDMTDAVDAILATMPDEEVYALVDAATAEAGPQVAEMAKQVIVAVRSYYRRRGNEIWRRTPRSRQPEA